MSKNYTLSNKTKQLKKQFRLFNNHHGFLHNLYKDKNHPKIVENKKKLNEIKLELRKSRKWDQNNQDKLKLTSLQDKLKQKQIEQNIMRNKNE